MTTPTKPPRQYGQHRGRLGTPGIYSVDIIWQRLHPGVPTDPIDGLGQGNYTPRHAASPERKRRYL